MYRFAILLTLFVALGVAGCGGGSDDDADSPPAAVAQTSDNEPSGDDTGAAPSDENKKKKDEAAEESSTDEDKAENADDGEPKTQKEEAGEAFEQLPSDRKLAAVETVVRSALLAFGLKLVEVELQDGGRKANAVVARKGACNFVASQEPNLQASIKSAVPGLKSVRFEVARTGQELGYYVVGCKKPEIPSGTGRVVFEHSGVGGPYTSKRFKITSKRWALEWVNEAASLAVIVVPVGGKSKGEYFKPVGSQKRESDRYEYKGSGTFQIKAHGAGGWRLRVKEIG